MYLDNLKTKIEQIIPWKLAFISFPNWWYHGHFASKFFCHSVIIRSLVPISWKLIHYFAKWNFLEICNLQTCHNALNNFFRMPFHFSQHYEMWNDGIDEKKVDGKNDHEANDMAGGNMIKEASNGHD